MKLIAIVYHSGMGHTKAIAESIARGAQVDDSVRVELMSVEAFEEPHSESWAALDRADAMVFGSPTYMGTVSAPFKVFMDATGSRWYSRRWMDKLAAGFTVGGGLSGDKQSTLQAMSIFACQHGMVWVSMGVGVGEDGIDRLSSSIGMMAQADDGPIEVTPPIEDHTTAERFGARVARLAMGWSNG